MLFIAITVAFSTDIFTCEDLVCGLLGEELPAKTSKLSGLGAAGLSGSAMFASSELSSEDLVCGLLGEEPSAKPSKPCKSGAMLDINVNIDASMLSEDWIRRLTSQKGALGQLISITINIDGLDICLPKECISVKVPAPVSEPTKVVASSSKESALFKESDSFHTCSGVKFPPLEEPKSIAQGIFDQLRKTKDRQVAMVALNKASCNALDALYELGVDTELKGLGLLLTNTEKGDTASKLKALQKLLDTGLEFLGDVVYPKGCEAQQKPKCVLRSLFRGNRGGRSVLLCPLSMPKK